MIRFVLVGMALLLSGCEADRDKQFAECQSKYGQLKYARDEVFSCMKAAGYKPVTALCAVSKDLTVRECWE
jgi:hypothetical protein